jgi:plastocyanin
VNQCDDSDVGPLVLQVDVARDAIPHVVADDAGAAEVEDRLPLRLEQLPAQPLVEPRRPTRSGRAKCDDPVLHVQMHASIVPHGTRRVRRDNRRGAARPRRLRIRSGVERVDPGVDERRDVRRFSARPLVASLVAVSTMLVLVAGASGGATSRQVQVLDACDPDSFNTVIGPGTCVRNGGVTFFEFVDQLLAQGRAPAWRFAPEDLKLAAGGTITARNRGGEFHTFTEVAAFGGGCVEELNDLLGLDPVPECEVEGIFAATGIGPEGELTTAALASGTHRFLCLIHPWMRSTATVS